MNHLREYAWVLPLGVSETQKIESDTFKCVSETQTRKAHF